MAGLRIIMIALLSCLWAVPSAALNLSQAENRLLEYGEVRYFFDDQGLTAEQVMAAVDTLDWQQASSALLTPPRSRHPAWILLDVHNDTEDAAFRLLELRWTNLREVLFYQYDSTHGELIELRAGLQYGPEVRYRHEASISFPLIVEKGETTQVLLKVFTSYNYLLPIYLWDERGYDEFQLGHYSLYAFLFGIMAVMFFYNMALWLFTRDAMYLIYSSYLLSITFFVLASSGIGEHLLWGNYLWFRLHAYGMAAMISFVTASLFLRYFLKLPKKGGWPLHLNNILLVYWGAVLLLYLTGTEPEVLKTELMSLVSTLCSLITGVYLALRGSRSALIFSAAWSSVILGTVIYILMLRGVLPFNGFTQYVQLFGFVLEIVLLSFALAERINQERRLRENAQNDLLLVQQAHSRDLEQRVNERTEELERATRELQSANRELQVLSVTDALTGLHNRRYFDDVLNQEIYRSHRLNQRLAMLLVDIDHFKQFNDDHGHLVGDQCLVSVARTMKEVFPREFDFVARYGGEEFAIILPGLDEQEAAAKAEELRARIADLSLRCGGSVLSVTASFGAVSLIADSNTAAKDVTDMADKALYCAKDDGRNCVRVFSPQMS